MLHVWNIYLHLAYMYGKCIGKYSIHGAYGTCKGSRFQQMLFLFALFYVAVENEQTRLGFFPLFQSYSPGLEFWNISWGMRGSQAEPAFGTTGKGYNLNDWFIYMFF